MSLYPSLQIPTHLLTFTYFCQAVRNQPQSQTRPVVTAKFILARKIRDKTVSIALEASSDGLLQGTIPSTDKFPTEKAVTATGSLSLKDVVSAIDDDLGKVIPDELKISFDQILFITDLKSKHLFGIRLGIDINLSNLPLVGKEFSKDQTLAINNLNILFASQEFPSIPARANLPQQNLSKKLPQGLSLSALLQFSGTSTLLDPPISQPSPPPPSENNGNGNSTDALPQASDPQSSDTVKWIDLKKNFGPLYFSRVGVQYQNSEVWFLLDASIAAAGLTLTLNGLAVGSPITQFKPKFNLRGLGVAYESKGALSIAGALLRTTTINDKGITKDTFSGAVIVKTEAFTLAAIASYTTTDDGHPSLFIYGVLNKTLGGPPFFFVTGLALGFAYNRSLILPTLEQIPQFPLVRAAMGEPNLKELGEIPQALKPYIPPRTGQVMLAIGVKFTSFKIIDSFILLIATFGDQFALDIIGISTLTSPPVLPGVDPSKLPPPIAQIRLAILARFVPAEGTLTVDGKILPDSFLFERNCQISGGFAFYSWFKDKDFITKNENKLKISAGDFVLTVGGYHPDFKVPDHYPKVDPLSLNWRVSNELTIKGSVYFALTASAIMAGGRMEAVWQSGDLKAWFIANAHFIVAWKPYFYDAQISVRVGASYTFDEKILGIRVRKTFSFDIGANLHIWGPEFSGTATIDLKITTLTIAFGNRTQQKPDPIDWVDFKTSFLPEQVCAISVEDGLLRKVEGSEIVIVNPKYFTLTASSVIPLQDKSNQKVGIAPMGVTTQELTSDFTFKFKQDGKFKNIDDFFNKVPIYKNVPSGLWAESNSNDPNRVRFIENVLSGYQIKPATGGTFGETHLIDQDKLNYDEESANTTYKWQPVSAFVLNAEGNENTRQDSIQATIVKDSVVDQRTKLLKGLGLSDIAIDLSDFSEEGMEQAFVISPQLQLA